MKINDKVLAAFLVSMGLFSTVQAQQYVNTLSENEKVVLLAAADDGGEAVPVDNNAVSGGGSMGNQIR